MATTKARKTDEERTTTLRKLTPTCKPPSGAICRRLPAEDVQLLRRLLSDLAECIYHDSFRRPSAEGRYLDRLDEVLHDSARPLENKKSSSPHRRALTADEEQELFLRFNYFRYRMMRILRATRGKSLSVRDAEELIRWDRLARRVRDEIADANLGLVPTMVERARVMGVDFADLISEGHLALLRSIDKFDTGRGFKFSTYACRAILTAITRSVALMARHRSRFPTEYDPDMQKSDFVESRRAGVEEDMLSTLQELLRDNVVDLSHVERRVLSERFGVQHDDEEVDGEGKTLRQVADTFGVTKERVRQIQNRALDKLRDELSEMVFVE